MVPIAVRTCVKQAQDELFFVFGFAVFQSYKDAKLCGNAEKQSFFPN